MDRPAGHKVPDQVPGPKADGHPGDDHGTGRQWSRPVAPRRVTAISPLCAQTWGAYSRVSRRQGELPDQLRPADLRKPPKFKWRHLLVGEHITRRHRGSPPQTGAAIETSGTRDHPPNERRRDVTEPIVVFWPGAPGATASRKVEDAGAMAGSRRVPVAPTLRIPDASASTAGSPRPSTPI